MSSSGPSSSQQDATATYRAYCQELGIKANSRVLAELPTTPAAVAAFTSWDLSGNAVGTKGAVAVARLVQSSLPHLKRLSLAGNNLASAATQELYNALVSHPSLSELDVSQNDIRLGGPALVDLVKRNKKIVSLNIEGTFLRPLFQRLIALHLKRNAEGPQEATAAPAAPAAAAPAASKSATVAAPPPRHAAVAAPHDAKTPPVSGKRRMKFAGADAGSDDDQHRETDRVSSPFMGGADGEAATHGDDDAAFGAFKEPFATTHDPNAADAAHAHAVGADADADAAAMMAQMKARGAKKQRRPTVSSEVYQEEEIDQFQPQKYDHPPEARQFLFETLENHELFSHLEDHELYVAVDAMFPLTRAKGDTLYEAADDELDTFFIIASGTVAVTSATGAVSQVSRGATLQDTMLLYAGKCNETAQAVTDVALFSLDRRTYRCVLSQASKKKRAMYEGFLSSVSFLKHLSKQELLALADALKPAHYEAGQRLITYGSTGENFFLIVEGTVDVLGRDDKGAPKWVCDFKEGDCVGELEFLHHHLCVADVVAKTPLVRTARMNRRHFEMVMGPVKDVLARTAQESEVFSYYRDQLSKIKEQGDQSPLRQTASPTPGATAGKH